MYMIDIFPENTLVYSKNNITNAQLDKLFKSTVLYSLVPLVVGTVTMDYVLLRKEFTDLCDAISKLDKTNRKEYKKERDELISLSAFRWLATDGPRNFSLDNFSYISDLINEQKSLFKNYIYLRLSDKREVKFDFNNPCLLLIEPKFNFGIETEYY